LDEPVFLLQENITISTHVQTPNRKEKSSPTMTVRHQNHPNTCIGFIPVCYLHLTVRIHACGPDDSSHTTRNSLDLTGILSRNHTNSAPHGIFLL
jgi:hypothetical protein